VAKLPKEIIIEEIHKVDYSYGDFVEMLEDIKRLRRKTGWLVLSITSSSSDNLVYLVAGDEGSASFGIPVKVLSRTLWTSRYPNNPEVGGLRRTIFGRGGVDKIAAMLNETPREADLEGPTPLDRILNEDP
jgi:hypothetical protein